MLLGSVDKLPDTLHYDQKLGSEAWCAVGSAVTRSRTQLRDRTTSAWLVRLYLVLHWQEETGAPRIFPSSGESRRVTGQSAGFSEWWVEEGSAGQASAEVGGGCSRQRRGARRGLGSSVVQDRGGREWLE